MMNSDPVRDCVNSIVDAITEDKTETDAGKALAALVGVAVIHMADAIVSIANSLERIADAQSSLSYNDNARTIGR